MDFQTVVQTCRNVRDFARKDIPGQVLNRILDAARIASSAYNFQPWRFVVIQDDAAKTQLAELCKGQSFVGAAAAVVACCGKKYQNPYNWAGEELYLVDVAIAVDHLQLAARNEGIGSCWIAVFEHEPVKALLQVPEDHDVVMLVPLGYPADAGVFHPTTDRLDLGQITFAEKFGNHWATRPRPVQPDPWDCRTINAG
ncbi:MAG: nitroreductase family protein [Phycisphaerae bacterium]